MSKTEATNPDRSHRAGMRRPELIVFDVNETLSDMTPMGQRFVDVGAPAHLAATWFAGLLRDGFALTAANSSARMAEIGSGLLRTLLPDHRLDRDLDEAVGHIMGGFAGLALHPDVAAGVESLAQAGIRLVTLTNGSTELARGLFERAGIISHFERLLSVEAAEAWKPAPAAYAYALSECDVEPRDALLVAVHPWDIDGASRAGLATAWLNRSSRSYPGYFRTADVEVDTLTGLAERLRTIS
jgi:2-haloacid dehalogenase